MSEVLDYVLTPKFAVSSDFITEGFIIKSGFFDIGRFYRQGFAGYGLSKGFKCGFRDMSEAASSKFFALELNVRVIVQNPPLL